MNRDFFTIGRDLECDISINSDMVSRVHLFIKKEDDNWYAIDNNSTNGTYLNSYNNKISKTLLKRDEILYLATYKLNTNLIFKLIESKDRTRKTIVYTDGISIGRDPKSDIPIIHPNISWQHAMILKEKGDYYIHDINSTNGTFVNNSVVKKKKRIEDGDKITLGVYSFIFKEEGKNSLTFIAIEDKGIRVDVKDISFSINTKDEHGNQIKKTILSNIEFTIYVGEMVGIIGLSGAGKTTLIKILSGYSKPTKGTVLINGKDLYKNFNSIKNFIGYVPQDDIIHPELSVYESLYYSSKLRLSSDFSDEEIDTRIDKVLQDLGIYEIKNVLIGSPDTKSGISGGQRKRVNIAMELLADPELIFLDEPTSGLSSVDSNIVMDKLKDLSNRGKTVVLTIHQPSLKNYKKMDNIVVLSEGKLTYFGPTYPDSITFFNQDLKSKDIINDPDNALLGLDRGEKDGKNWQKIYSKSKLAQKFVKERLNNIENKKFDNFKSDNRNSFWSQFRVLKDRFLTIKLRDKVNIALILGQAPLIALLLIFLFSGSGYELYENSPFIVLFIFLISAIWFGVIGSVKEIVSERAIYERERFFGLKIAPYILSKFVVLAGFSLIQVIILVVAVDIGISLKIDIIPLILIVYITALIGIGIGLLISSIVKSVAQALSWVPIVLLPIIIFSGGIIPIKKMSTTPSIFNAYAVSFAIPTRWTLEEAIRIYDNSNSNLKGATREPIKFDCSKPYDKNKFFCEDENNALYPISLYDGLDATCKNRKCIQELYIGNYSDEKFVWRNNSTTLIYIVAFLYIAISLLLTIAILKKQGLTSS